MAILAQIARTTVSAGVSAIPQVNVPLGVTTIRLSVTRFAWPGAGATVMSAKFEISIDGGVTWPYGVAADIGASSPFKGDPNPPALIGLVIPGDPQNAQRRVRGSVNCAQPLDLSVLIEGV